MPNPSAICRCCGSNSRFLWRGDVLGEPANYFDCAECGYVQTEMPHWLERAYAVAINVSDTGIMARNQDNARLVLATMLSLGKLKGKVVDCAGGYGILVRMLRDYGVDAFWSDRYCENLLARGFAYESGEADLATAFEAFEHFVNPAKDLDSLLAIAPNILLSTLLIPDPAPAPGTWWYYGAEHGQHIGFFRLRTLKKLVADRGKFLLSDGCVEYSVAVLYK